MVKRLFEPQIYCLRDAITRWVRVKYCLEEILICNSLLWTNRTWLQTCIPVWSRCLWRRRETLQFPQIQFLVNDQIDAQFFSTCLFQFSTCFEQPRAHHQENRLYQYIWYMSLCVGGRFVCRSETHETVTDTEWHMPDVVLIRLIVLMMSTRLLETCRELK